MRRIGQIGGAAASGRLEWPPAPDAPMINGAGIATDPTLTDAWPFPKERTWRPMFRHPAAPKRGCQGLSPALAPASGSTFQRVLFGRSGPKPSLPSKTPPSTGSSAVESPAPVPQAVVSRPVRRPFQMPPSGADRTIRPVNETTSHFPHHHSCIRPKPSAGVTLDVRGQVPPRHPGLDFPGIFRRLGRPIPEGFRPVPMS